MKFFYFIDEIFTEGNIKLGAHKPHLNDYIGFINTELIFHSGQLRQKLSHNTERYRHRYHMLKNTDKLLYNENASMLLSPHPFWCGVQFHPEFNSGWGSPSPYFTEFVKVTAKNNI